jgi:hypothetical protein
VDEENSKFYFFTQPLLPPVAKKLQQFEKTGSLAMAE